MDFRPRVSIFFFVIGLGFLALFILLALGNQVAIIYLLLAVASFILGGIVRPKKEPTPSARFETLRKMNQQSRDRRQARLNKNRKK